MKTLICRKCKKTNTDIKSSYCEYCGHSLKGALDIELTKSQLASIPEVETRHDAVRTISIGAFLGAITGFILPLVLGYGVGEEEGILSTILFAIVGGGVVMICKAFGKKMAWVFILLLILQITLLICACVGPAILYPW